MKNEVLSPKRKNATMLLLQVDSGPETVFNIAGWQNSVKDSPVMIGIT
jgi:hypothetical protein